MTPAVWRAAALFCTAAAIAFVCYELTIPDRQDFGLHFTGPTVSAGLNRVIAVDAGSAAARAGIRAGETISFGKTPMERARAVYATPGARVTLFVNGTRPVTLTARSTARVSVLWGATAIRFAFLLIAALLAWRRPDDPAARALVVFLWCYGLAIAIMNGVLPTPLLSLLVMQVGTLALFFIGTASAAVFAARFPSGNAQPLPRALARLAVVLAIVSLIATVVLEFVPHSVAMLPALNAGLTGSFALIGLLVAATLAVAYVQGAPAERQRRRWVFLLLGAGLAGPLIDIIVTGVFGYSTLVDQLTLLSLGLLPIGLAYVILRHRVIDVGFVVNRAVVYTGVSLIVVGVFVVVETLLAKYVESTSHVTSVAVELAVALALGFSIRFIHSRVDRVVDNILFRERHLAEAAIRNFAHEASYVTDAGVLLSRCASTVERYARARGAGVWLAESASYRAAVNTFAVEPAVDENDPAVVSMRARRVNVRLREADSVLPGVLAFPMIVRGELLGILVCGPKADDETYAPDEEDALASLASSVGHALDAIEVRELRRRLASLTATGGGQPAF